MTARAVRARQLLIPIVAALLVCACGSSGEPSSRSEDTEESATSLDLGALDDQDDISDECADLVTAYEWLAELGVGPSTPDDSARLEEALDSARESLPDDLSDELDVVAGVVAEREGSGIDAALEMLSSPAVVEATSRLQDWQEKHC